MKTVYTTTFHGANNYGAVLQAYALQRVLAKKYNTQILNYNNPTISDSWKLFQKPQNDNLYQRIVQFTKDICNLKINICRHHNFKKFNNQLVLTKKYNKADLLKNHYPVADTYITGSDQVWNPELTNGIDDIYTLNFGKHDFSKIAYAGSVGDNQTLAQYTDALINRLNDFDAISVREKQLQQLLNSKNIKSTLTLDPSLLLTKAEWQKMTPQNSQPKQKYILAYSWEEPDIFFESINRLAQQTGCAIYYYHRRDYKNLFHSSKKSYFKYGPQDFLALIQNAEYVFTTSFHGTALSSIFNKNFYVFLTRRPERIVTLLNSINLSSRIIVNKQDFNRALQQNIDWGTVNQLIDQKRTESLNWLYDAIDKD